MGSATPLIRDYETMRRYARRLRSDIGASHVYLFGSQATGHARPDSDYDLIVVAESFESVPRVRRGMGLRDLFYDEGGDASLDLICMTPDEFENAKRRITLVADVLPEAIDLLAEEPAPA